MSPTPPPPPCPPASCSFPVTAATTTPSPVTHLLSVLGCILYDVAVARDHKRRVRCGGGTRAQEEKRLSLCIHGRRRFHLHPATIATHLLLPFRGLCSGIQIRRRPSWRFTNAIFWHISMFGFRRPWVAHSRRGDRSMCSRKSIRSEVAGREASQATTRRCRLRRIGSTIRLSRESDEPAKLMHWGLNFEEGNKSSVPRGIHGG